MSKKSPGKMIDRRSFLRGAGGALVASAGVGLVPSFLRKALLPAGYGTASAAPADPPDLFFAGTDGWISLPPSPAIGAFHPDPLAPAGLTTYIFGFRNVTGLSDAQRAAQKNKAQHNAPMFWVKQFDPAHPRDFKMRLTNLGLALRPDLFDAHTLHWHGFRNVIPFFDGEPTGSVSVPTGRIFDYIYRPRDPGTYMFHCHVEDVEHVHMGMTGPVFVRPLMGDKFAYNDAATGFDREFAMFLSEVWAEAHWADAHIQLPEWSDYRADFALLNGRAYPDTLAPNAPFNPATSANALAVNLDGDGDLMAPAGRPDLKHQPLSALVTCCAGERVLLRFANLGFKEASMTLPGIRMQVVGKDATPMRGRDGTDTSYQANTISFGAGESIDAIFTAPPKTGTGYDTYLLYNRQYERSNNLGGGFGGQRTEIRVYAAGALPAQTLPNT
jgi:FtsP/CotA-like multicopper oxidase with cupredoxin domain